MKSVMFSEIVHAQRGAGWLRGLSPLTAYGLTVAIGMPLLVLALRALDPGAPLAVIVLPMLAGLALPLCAGTPGRLEVSTRFDAATCATPWTRRWRRSAMPGQRQAGPAALCQHHRPQLARTGAHGHDPHPCPHARGHRPDPDPARAAAGLVGRGALACRRCRRTCPRRAGLPSRETVAGAMQISDNAGRVAGMAE
jgi:hypothetical protein